jgi:anti-sigma factor RsiW
MRTHVETELVAYLDGELSTKRQAQVSAHLRSCPRCSAELDRLKELRRDLGTTLDTALSPVRLPADADVRIRERIRRQLARRAGPQPWAILWRQRGLLAQAALAVVALLFTMSATQVLGIPSPAAPHETLVIGQEQLVPGSQAALRVIVRSPAGPTGEAQPVEGADVVVRIGRAPGLAKAVYTGQTDADGTAHVAFTVPEDIDRGSLVVETTSATGQGKIVRPIAIAREYKLLLYSDKPAYRPGQTIHIRTLALDATNLQAASDQLVKLTITNPFGVELEQRRIRTSEFGIANFDFELASAADDGQYTLQVALDDTTSERTVTVGRYELPAFRVTLDTERTFYSPGERVIGTVQAAYFHGQPVAHSQIALRGYTKSPRTTPAIQVQGKTNAEGVATFGFDVPPGFGESATAEPVSIDLEAEVTDAAGQRAGTRTFLPVSAQTILIQAVPEGGWLKPNIENAVYIATAYPDGRPAQTTLAVEAEGETHTLTSGPYGLAEFRYTPGDSSGRIKVQAQDTQGNQGSATFSFPQDRTSQALLLRTEQASYKAGDTLRAEAFVAGAETVQTVYLDIVHTRQTVATLSSPVEDGRALFALDLDETMVGTLEIHAYHITLDGTIVRDTRLVIVDASRQLAVTVDTNREAYRPGETASVQIQTSLTSTRQAKETPVQAALGIGVVDASVQALETLPAGFIRAYFLMEDELRERQAQGLDVPTLLDAEEDIRAAQDVAARAAWAGVEGSDFTLTEVSVAEPAQDTGLAARVLLSNRIGIALTVLPLLLSGVTVWGLRLTGVLGRALRRVTIGALALFVTAPVVGLIAGGVMWLLWGLLGVGAPLMILAVIVVLLLWLVAHGWLRRDTRVHLAAGLLATYLVLGALLVFLAARGGDPTGLALTGIVLTFLLAVAAAATLGQGLVIEGVRATGWATTAMALLLIPLATYLPFVPGAASGLTRTLGDPALYAGPAAWLTGCCPAAAEPEVVEKEVVVTQVVEKEGEAVVVTVMAEPTMVAEEVSSTEAPAEPTPTVVSLPTEPYPLRQVFPETLYWDPEAVTGEDGSLAFTLPLADTITTWQLTALASTREGELGAATHDIVVFQDFFLQLKAPEVITKGETVTVTVTLYNYLPDAQTIGVEPRQADWYALEAPPEQVVVPANGVAAVEFAIRPEQAGAFSLAVTARGDDMLDGVAVDVTVVEAP